MLPNPLSQKWLWVPGLETGLFQHSPSLASDPELLLAEVIWYSPIFWYLPFLYPICFCFCFVLRWKTWKNWENMGRKMKNVAKVCRKVDKNRKLWRFIFIFLFLLASPEVCTCQGRSQLALASRRVPISNPALKKTAF